MVGAKRPRVWVRRPAQGRRAHGRGRRRSSPSRAGAGPWTATVDGRSRGRVVATRSPPFPTTTTAPATPSPQRGKWGRQGPGGANSWLVTRLAAATEGWLVKLKWPYELTPMSRWTSGLSRVDGSSCPGHPGHLRVSPREEFLTRQERGTYEVRPLPFEVF